MHHFKWPTEAVNHIQKPIHFLCFTNNAVLERSVGNSKNFDGVAYIA